MKQPTSNYTQTTPRLCYETFGSSNNPAVLLIMGASAQGILWPDYYCHFLADNNYFVIRYDHRDTGLSATSLDFNLHPYTLPDLARDALNLLAELGVKRAHIIGTSMGGYLAQLIALFNPDLVASLTLIASTTDLSCLTDIIDGKDAEDCKIIAPLPKVIAMLTGQLVQDPKADELTQLVASWRILNGDDTPFAEDFFYDLAKRSLECAINPAAAGNHLAAIRATNFDYYAKLLPTIKQPTLIMHGVSDPILPLKHGKTIANTLPNSRFIVIPYMGHMLAPKFDELITRRILEHLKGIN